MRQPTMDNGETAKNMEEGKDESSEASNYEYSYNDLPAQQTFKQEDNSTPYHPHAHTQSVSRTGTLKRERPHSLNPHSYSHWMQSHNTRRTSSSYQPPHSYAGASPRTNDPSSSSTTDLAKYLIRREMISSGLLTFDDRPKNYWAWKESFHSSTVDLSLTAREELDLLCKWLGPKSSEHAKRTTAGVSMLWQRLEDCYGSPEAIENALLKKVDEFPRILDREKQRLRELGDLLLELEAALNTWTLLVASLQSSRDCHTPCMTNGSLKHLITNKPIAHHTHLSPSLPSLFVIKPKYSMIRALLHSQGVRAWERWSSPLNTT